MTTRTSTTKSVYITGAHLLDPSAKINHKGDLLIENGKILASGKVGELKAKAKAIKAETIEADGLYLSPGFVDLSCSIYEPGTEHIEGFITGSSAAASGGFTSILVKPVSNPVNDNAFMTDFILRKAAENSIVRVYPMGAFSASKEGKKLAEIGSMVAAGVCAVGDGSSIMDSYLMRKGLEYSKAFHVPIFSFPEDRGLAGQGIMNEGLNSNRLGLRGIPPAAEEIMVARDLVLARHAETRIHFQPVSTDGAIALVRDAKKNGIAVTAETHAPYFSLTHDVISSYDAIFKCFPPLRSKSDVEAMKIALADGTIDVVSSGHTPQPRSAKEQSFEQAAAGMIGLETTFSLLNELVEEKHISVLRLVELLSTNPAKILGLTGAGTLKKGSDGDIVLLDLKSDYFFTNAEVRSASKNSPFFGRKMKGQVVRTFVGGTEIFSRKRGTK